MEQSDRSKPTRTDMFRHADGIRSNNGDDLTLAEQISLLASSVRMRIDPEMRLSIDVAAVTFIRIL